MARTGAKIGKKTQLLRETPVDGGVYVEVAEVKSIGGPSLSRDAVDATHLASDDDYGEYIAGLKESGELSLVLNFRPDHVSQGSTAGLLKDFEDGTVRLWRVAWPQFTNTPTMTAAGFITGWEPQAGARDLLTVAVKIKLTGKPTLANFA